MEPARKHDFAFGFKRRIGRGVRDSIAEHVPCRHKPPNIIHGNGRLAQDAIFIRRHRGRGPRRGQYLGGMIDRTAIGIGLRVSHKHIVAGKRCVIGERVEIARALVVIEKEPILVVVGINHLVVIQGLIAAGEGLIDRKYRLRAGHALRFKIHPPPTRLGEIIDAARQLDVVEVAAPTG